MNSTTGTPTSEKICPSVLYSAERGSHSTRISPATGSGANGGGGEQRRRRRVVVVGAAGRRAQPVAAAVGVVDVLHVGGVVVVAHDHRLAAIAAGDHEHDVALVGAAVLVAGPAAHPREVEVGL